MILLIIKLLLAQVKQMTQHQKQMQQINRPRLSVSILASTKFTKL